jgi:hypothetical protein
MEQAGRRLAVATSAGALSGLLVGGIGGRLAMMLLARLAPETAGIRSDDDFVIGQFTLAGTLNLLVLGTVLGVLGGGVYLVLRSLMIGPRWFQILSISLGSAVTIGSMLVHADGVDFVLLRPAWQAIALFVAIPGGYAALLTVLCERWLHHDAGFPKARRVVAFAPLILWLPFAPVLVVGVLGWVVVESQRQHDATRALMEHPLTPWVARLGLAVVFGLFLVNLIGDIAVLT